MLPPPVASVPVPPPPTKPANATRHLSLSPGLWGFARRRRCDCNIGRQPPLPFFGNDLNCNPGVKERHLLSENMSPRQAATAAAMRLQTTTVVQGTASVPRQQPHHQAPRASCPRPPLQSTMPSASTQPRPRPRPRKRPRILVKHYSPASVHTRRHTDAPWPCPPLQPCLCPFSLIWGLGQQPR